jgi:hypothetical protein
MASSAAATTAAARSSTAPRAGDASAAPRRAPSRRPASQTRRRPPTARRARRISGPAVSARSGSTSVALPLRVLDARFARALRARTGGVLDALLAGRGWIALVGVLLVGIVFFNVDLLRMNREIALTAERAAVVKRENARLRQEAALLGSSQRIQDAGAELGLVMPVAGDVRYLKAHPGGDARRAARLIVEPNDLAVVPAPTAVATPEPVAPVTTPDATAAPGQTGVTTPTAGTGTDAPATGPEAAVGGTATAPGGTAQQAVPPTPPTG